jgi:dCMP deaminase
MTRKSWDEYFLDIAEQVSARSTCNRLHVGCVIVKDKHIVATGYNGSIHGHEHCEDAGCLLGDDNRCHRTIHAETNACLHADRDSLKGATAYVTHEPCENCSKILAQASNGSSTATPIRIIGTGTFSRIWRSSTCRRNLRGGTDFFSEERGTSALLLRPAAPAACRTHPFSIEVPEGTSLCCGGSLGNRSDCADRQSVIELARAISERKSHFICVESYHSTTSGKRPSTKRRSAP